mmetsp:Transcript_6430/g.15738  ORF Transcript_6430/g.15738 Transcript_6430/m.15738 type:complete len:236 (-) Transcript_6430:1741-2448(-)
MVGLFTPHVRSTARLLDMDTPKSRNCRMKVQVFSRKHSTIDHRAPSTNPPAPGCPLTTRPAKRYMGGPGTGGSRNIIVPMAKTAPIRGKNGRSWMTESIQDNTILAPFAVRTIKMKIAKAATITFSATSVQFHVHTLSSWLSTRPVKHDQTAVRELGVPRSRLMNCFRAENTSITGMNGAPYKKIAARVQLDFRGARHSWQISDSFASCLSSSCIHFRDDMEALTKSAKSAAMKL